MSKYRQFEPKKPKEPSKIKTTYIAIKTVTTPIDRFSETQIQNIEIPKECTHLNYFCRRVEYGDNDLPSGTITLTQQHQEPNNNYELELLEYQVALKKWETNHANWLKSVEKLEAADEIKNKEIRLKQYEELKKEFENKDTPSIN